MFKEVFLVGQPIVDRTLHMSAEAADDKGAVEYIDDRTFSDLARVAGSKISKPYAAGSGTNTLKVLASLGYRCKVIGVVGKDEDGNIYRERTIELGITPLLSEHKLPTGKCLSLVSPKAQRTMRTMPGAAEKISADHLSSMHFEPNKHFHLEGYLVTNTALVNQVIQTVKESRSTLSFDLANFNFVHGYKDKFLEVIHSSAIEILFGNESEVEALSGEEKNPESGARDLAKYCKVVVMTKGEDGCFVVRGEEEYVFKAIPTTPKDTTGAGDYFAGGFLAMYLQGCPIEKCIEIATKWATAIIEVSGTDLSPRKIKELKEGTSE